MLDMERHTNCPIWNDTEKLNSITSEPMSQWNTLKYSCQNVMQTYCKIFNPDELIDLMVRYITHQNEQNFKKYCGVLFKHTYY